tara:strand:+ start:6694 stop:7851 length:1158 start_codon:yes stop_codon:yes gene_type:complete
MNKEIIYTNSDELSFEAIFHFFKILYKKSFLFSFLLILSIIFSGIYYLSPSSKKDVSINLYPVSDSYVVQFKNFNNFDVDGFSVPVNITSTGLMDDFYNQFKNSNALNNYVEKIYDLQSFSGTPLEKNILIEQLSKNFLIKKISEENNPDFLFLNLSFKSENITSDLKFIMELISELELNVNEDYKDVIEQTEIIMNDYYDKTLKDLEKNISLSLDKQEFENDSYLGFLEEQSKIARELNIDIPAPEQTQYAKQSQNLGIIGSTMEDDNYARYPFYFRGYVAIEKEMDLIKSRERNEIFAKDYAEKKIQIQINKEKNAIRDLNLISSNTPLFVGDFKAIEYDFNKIFISEPPIKVLITFLIMIAGFILSLFIVYASARYDDYKAN